MPSALVSVFLYDQEQDALIKFASHSETGKTPNFWPKIPRKIYDQWLSTYGATIIAPNINALERFGEIVLPENFPFYTYLSISLHHEGQLIGCLDLVTLDEIQQPTKQEITLIQAIANQAATAIANAKLF